MISSIQMATHSASYFASLPLVNAWRRHRRGDDGCPPDRNIESDIQREWTVVARAKANSRPSGRARPVRDSLRFLTGQTLGTAIAIAVQNRDAR